MCLPVYKMAEFFFLAFFPELFPAPILRAIPSAEPQAGGPMTLSCQTKLPLQRSAARLLFSFYKDGRTVLRKYVRKEGRGRERRKRKCIAEKPRCEVCGGEAPDGFQ